jgi:ornithine decarboxylase
LNDIDVATPFVATDCGVVAARLEAFVRAMPGVRPYFAFECNSAPPVLAALADGGAGFAIRSIDELDPLAAVGVRPEDVLFGDTVKPERHVRDAALRGVWRFALGSEEELRKIADAAPGSAVYVRMNVGDSRSPFPGARNVGTSADEALRILRLAPELGLRPYGLAFHVGPQCTDPAMYSLAIERCGLVMRRLEQVGTRIEMLDIGGGMPATCSEAVPDIAAVGEAVRVALARLPYRPAVLAARPSRYLVAECSVMAATVIGVGRRGGLRWAYIDIGGYRGLMEALRAGGRLFPIRTSRADDSSAASVSFNVTGLNGESSDVLFQGAGLPETLEAGDRLYIGTVGAYTLSYASNANGSPVPSQVFV